MIDCTESEDAELFIVEGQSAAGALRQVRDRRFQAILPMQGKIPNAVRTSTERLLQHLQIADLLQSMHPERIVAFNTDLIRYKKIHLLCDPDMDGMHSGLLLMLFFYQHLRGVIEGGQLYLVRAPLFGLYRNSECVALAYSDKQLALLQGQLELPADVRRFKGVASLDAALLGNCISPDSRARQRLSVAGCRDMCKQLLPG